MPFVSTHGTLNLSLRLLGSILSIRFFWYTLTLLYWSVGINRYLRPSKFSAMAALPGSDGA